MGWKFHHPPNQGKSVQEIMYLTNFLLNAFDHILLKWVKGNFG